MISLDKLSVHETALELLRKKISLLRNIIEDNREGLISNSKSTAGDKHETSRAMAHLEQEKLGAQYSEALKLKELIHRIDPSKVNTTVVLGSLAETSIGWLYLSIGLGQIDISDEKIFCLTPIAPLGKALLGKKAGDEIDWQGKKIQVLSVK